MKITLQAYIDANFSGNIRAAARAFGKNESFIRFSKAKDNIFVQAGPNDEIEIIEVKAVKVAAK